MLVGEQNEESHPHRDGGHQVGEKGYAVDVIGPFTSPVFGHRVADEGADGARQQGTAHTDPAKTGPSLALPRAGGVVMAYSSVSKCALISLDYYGICYNS